jgi:thioredoxin-dependent peroxiredoxin
LWVERIAFSETHPAQRVGFIVSAETHPKLDGMAHRSPIWPEKIISTRRESKMSTATASETFTMPRINDTAPDFTAETTQGTIHFHEWIGDGWAVLFSHPKDFTPICTTELGTMAGLQPEFAKRNAKVIGLSVDPVSDHHKWLVDIEETQGHKVTYPMIGDPQLKVAKLYGMLPAESGDTSQGRTANDNATVRTVFVIGPDKKIKLMLAYPMTTGRNFDEILRVLDALQLTTKHKVGTPANWKQGGDIVISPAVSNDEAQKLYPGGWKTLRPYLRVAPQPK